MRVTRAAQRAQQDVEEPVEAVEAKERILQDIEPNAASEEQPEEPLPAKTPAKTPAKKGKAKATKKAAKGHKAKAEEDDVAPTVEEAEPQAAANPDVEEEHIDDVAEDLNEKEQLKPPRTPATRLTRRQQAKLEEEGDAQREPRTLEDDAPGAVTEQAAERMEMAVEDEATPIVQEVPEPPPTSKPARRTRRQQTKVEEEEGPEQQTNKDITEIAVEQTGAHVTVEDVAEPEGNAAPVAQDPAEVKSKPAPKPKRLTKKQQTKLEEEQHQTEAEQQTEQPEPIEEVTVEEIDATAQNDVVDKKEHGFSIEDANDTEELPTPVVAAEQGPSIEEETTSAPLESESKVPATGLSDDGPIVDTEASDSQIVEPVQTETDGERPMTPTDAEFEADFEANLDAQMTDVAHDGVSSSGKDVSPVEPKMLVSTPAKYRESSGRTSRSSAMSPVRLEESISAIDRLEEDLESIGEAIPDLNHSEDEKAPKTVMDAIATTTIKGKTPGKTPMKTPAKASTQTPMKAASKTLSKTPAKASIQAKVPTAMTKAPVASKTTLPATKVLRVPSTAPKSVKPSVKPATSSLARASSVRTAPSKDARKSSTEPADYLASKRRPISLSFPTPPPPPKGRAPTKPTFQLSSDNVAAKLRAQKEERLKREAEGTTAPKQRPISMPPPPKSTKPPTKPSFQLPGEATAARLKAQKEERLKRMQEAGGPDKPAPRPISMPPPPKSTKPVTKPTFQLPGEATAAKLKAQKEERLKRMEEAEAAKKAALAAPIRKPIAHRPRNSLLVKDAPGVSIPPPSKTDAPQRSASTASVSRNSAVLAENGKPTAAPVDAVALKAKGKQVFNRDKMEKDAAERERKEKEEAAKKARAEAAERGRIASREWAERQRKKLMGQ
ncbi:hypothetical protein G6514_008293 [Epicoccum nigrum]|nr:hypothetical protein G6514_008293 [Epicoccum nigrum]